MNTQKITSKQERMPLPTKVAGVLRFRDMRDLDCPQEILLRIDNLKIGKMVYNFKGGAPSPTPNSPSNYSSSNNNISTQSNSWRSSRTRDYGNSDRHASNGNNHGGGGFRSNAGGGGGLQSNSWDRPLTIRRVQSDLSTNSIKEDETPHSQRRFRGQNSSSPSYNDSPGSPAFTGGRYVSSIVSEKNVDERIIGHIRAKLNKFSQNNYEGVKSFLEQIMNSGEVEFLTEFMDLLFTKAASEEMYCALYSRLLSELCDKFPFLRGEIIKIYSNFLAIFQEARDIPDQNSSDYKKFLESQEKKKYRQGYSHFLAEIFNKGLLPADSMETTVSYILNSLAKLEKDQSNTLLVEEYLVSLSKIVTTIDIAKAAPLPPFLVNMLDTLKKTIEKAKTDTPGYTTKSRFKIMDIIDILPN
jgi:hypothetical protein